MDGQLTLDDVKGGELMEAFKTAISTSGLFDGIMDGITSSLPIIIPVMAGALAIRKGVSFLFGQLRRA